jgi:hypothetical protein
VLGIVQSVGQTTDCSLSLSNTHVHAHMLKANASLGFKLVAAAMFTAENSNSLQVKGLKVCSRTELVSAAG